MVLNKDVDIRIACWYGLDYEPSNLDLMIYDTKMKIDSLVSVNFSRIGRK